MFSGREQGPGPENRTPSFSSILLFSFDAEAVQDFQPCPAVKAIGFDFGCGVALREQGENVPKLLVT